MKNKKLLITILSIIIFGILLISIYLILKKDEILGKYISTSEYTKEMFNDEKNTNSGNIDNINEIMQKENEDQVNFDKISSMVRVLCINSDNIVGLVNSPSFKLIKKEILNIKNKINENKDKFTYVDLPGIVFSNCKKDDDTFSSKLLNILQTDGVEVIVSTQEELNGLYKFVDEIKFDSININNKNLKNSKDYFYEVFFQKNIKSIISSYFFETSYNSDDIKKYIYTNTLMSFGEANDLLEKSVGKFQDFVKKLGFKDLAEFNNYLLKYNGYNNLEELKIDLIKIYEKLSTETINQLSFNLDENVMTLDSLNNFYNGDNFKKLNENETTYNLYKKISELHLYFAIIGGDYANNLGEGWSGKMFFGDSLKGNGIIRLSYLYLFDKLK